MREKSHKIGEEFVRASTGWLCSGEMEGYTAEPFGHAYDASRHAAKVGSQFFDFAIKLSHGGDTRGILYGECKYRNERTGSTTTAFRDFLCMVHDALADADSDQVRTARFYFVSNLPPGDWRTFLKDREAFVRELVSGPDEERVRATAARTQVLVVSEAILGVNS